MAETQPVLPAEDELLPVLQPMPITLNGRVRSKKWGIWLPSGDRLDQSGYISND